MWLQLGYKKVVGLIMSFYIFGKICSDLRNVQNRGLTF